jgi:hypothetical protein
MQYEEELKGEQTRMKTEVKMMKKAMRRLMNSYSLFVSRAKGHERRVIDWGGTRYARSRC